MARNALVLNYGKMNNKFTLCTIYKRYLGYVLKRSRKKVTRKEIDEMIL